MTFKRYKQDKKENKAKTVKVVICSIFFLSFIFFSLFFISALPNDAGTSLDFKYTIPTNFSSKNVNNSQFLQGFNSSDFVKILGDTWRGNMNAGGFNITNIAQLIATDGSAIKQGNSNVFTGVDQALNLQTNQTLGAGVITHVLTDLQGGRIIEAWQSGKNNSAGFHRNSYLIFGDLNITNASVLTNARQMWLNYGLDSFIDYDTATQGAALGVQWGIETQKIFIHDDLGNGQFLMDGGDFRVISSNNNDIDLYEGAVHILDLEVRQVGSAIGANLTILDAKFTSSLAPFTLITSGKGIDEWAVTPNGGCPTGSGALCSHAGPTGGAGDTIMQTNISSLDLQLNNLSFNINTLDMGSGGDFEVIMNNNVGSGDVSIYSLTLADELDQIINVSIPVSMDNKSVVSIEFVFSSLHPNKGDIWVDNILVTATTTSDTQVNITFSDGEIKFGDSTCSIKVNGTDNSMTFGGLGCGQMIFSGNTTFQNEIVVSLNSSGNIDAGGNITTLQSFITQLTEGSVPFIGVNGEITEDNANLFWNDTSNRLGIGGIPQTGKLHLVGTDTTNTPKGEVIMSRFWVDDTNTRASSIFHAFVNDGSEDRMLFGVSGVGGTFGKPNTLSMAKMALGADGNLGIGELNPQGILHTLTAGGSSTVRHESTGAGKFSFLYLIGNSAGGSELWFGDENSDFAGAIRYSHVTNSMDFRANGISDLLQLNSTLFRVNLPLNVLGTTNLSGDTIIEEDLNVNGMTAIGGNFTPLFALDIRGTNDATGTVRLQTSSSNNGFKIETTNANAGARNWAVLANSLAFGDFAIKQSTTQGGDAKTGNVGLYIANSLNVGIGTTTPTTILQTNGEIRASRPGYGDTQYIQLDTDKGASIGIEGFSTSSNQKYMTIDNLFTSGGVSGVNNNIQFRTGAIDAPVTRMTIRGDTGNFGINTITPTHRFNVFGTTNLSGDTIIEGDLNVSEDINIADSNKLILRTNTSQIYSNALNQLTMEGLSGVNINAPILSIIPTGSVGQIRFDASLSGRMTWLESGVEAFSIWSQHGIDSMYFNTNDKTGNQIVISNTANANFDTDHATQIDPTLYIQSDTNPNTDNTQWLSLSHNQSNAIIESGNGSIVLRNNVSVEGDLIVSNGFSGTCINTTYVGGIATSCND